MMNISVIWVPSILTTKILENSRYKKEMKKQIMKYYTDKEYYLKMSNRAKERVKILLDTDSEFERIIREVELRETEHTEGDRV